MVATDLDIAVTARIWRACAAVGTSQLFVGSADAIGEGYGAILGCESVIYQSRGARIKNSTASIYLGLLPPPQSIEQRHGDLVVKLKVDSKQGIAVTVEGIKPPDQPLSAEIHSWIAGRFGDRQGAQKPSSIHALGLSVSVTKDGLITVNPKTPEATIRFASACSSRNFLFLNIVDDYYASSDSCLIVLAPSDTAPCDLPADVYSRSGPLADWLRIPPLRLILDISPEVRAAIDLWLREAQQNKLEALHEAITN